MENSINGVMRYRQACLSLAAVVWMMIFACAIPSTSFGAEASGSDFGDNVRLRGSLDNSRRAFERTGKGNVAFMGGSITEMNGFRPMVSDSLKRRFPGTAFTFNNAGVSSTCSTTGAFRLATDVMAKGPVDLLFVEFAVNDDQDARHTRAECIRGMEGIIRHARELNPKIDIVVTYFVNPEMLQTLQSGQTPLPIEAHEAVAEHYTVSSINVAREVAAEIKAGTLTWEVYGGTHPAPAGHALCARMIDSLFDRAWVKPLAPNAPVRANRLPKDLLDPFSYVKGRFIDVSRAKVLQGWTLGIPDWQRLPGEKRDRFTSLPMLCATEPSSTLTLDFEGTAAGAYILAGPDAGICEASIDGGPVREVELFHAFSSGLHYPRTVLLGSELRPGKHKLTLRISAKTHSAGHAMRILQFTAN
jgi:lysophospholipase L1-like esterase